MHLSRRTLLRGFGAAAIAAPFLDLLSSRKAHASTRPKRLAIFFSPNGTKHSRYWPESNGGLSFPAGSILEPLAQHKDRLLVLKGINFLTQWNHEPGFETMLTGVSADASTWGATQGQSVDQYIGSKIGDGSRFKTLDLGVQTDAWGAGVQTRMLYAPGHVLVHPDQNPMNVFTRVFGDAGSTADQSAAKRKRKQSVLDLVKGELDGLRTELGTLEKTKLDAHTDAIRQLEQQLASASTPLSCSTPQPLAEFDVTAQENFPKVATSQMDLMALALACGSTRVATLQMAHTVGPLTMSWLGHGATHHDLSHQQSEEFVQGERWYAEQFSYLLTKLASLPEADGSGTVLDNTLVVWAKELADGTLHDATNVPWVLAGATGYLKTGRLLDVGGKPHQKLLVSICQAMGLSDDTYGAPGYEQGPLADLTL